LNISLLRRSSANMLRSGVCFVGAGEVVWCASEVVLGVGVVCRDGVPWGRGDIKGLDFKDTLRRSVDHWFE